MRVKDPGAQPSVWVRAVAGASPVGAVLLLYAGLMATLRTSSLVPAVAMIGLSLGLLLSGGIGFAAMNRMPRRVKLAMSATAALACLGWAWQRGAYLALIPKHFLTYGYFLTPPGTVARVYLLAVRG
jgi:hypothetical protein